MILVESETLSSVIQFLLYDVITTLANRNWGANFLVPCFSAKFVEESRPMTTDIKNVILNGQNECGVILIASHKQTRAKLSGINKCY